jgi:RNA polymerase sigma-70 factor (ECF subfamily)
MFGKLFATAQSPPQESVHEMAEEQLLELASSYDEAALGELYDRYESKIYSYIYRRTNSPALAEDLTAQVFLKMLEAIQNDKGWHSSFSGWLYRIAHNLVIDHYRRRDRRQYVSIDDAPVLPATGYDPVETAELTLDAERLQAAIRRLTEEQAMVITLRFLEGYSINEVAVMLNKTDGAIKALQYRAVSTLRDLLERELR